MKKHTVSVVIPAHEKGFLLERALDSVRGQTLKPDEIILVLDGITSSNINVKECKVITTRQGSASGSRNMGIKHAKSEYIAFLDSDDYWAPEKLEVQLKEIKKTTATPTVVLTDLYHNNKYYTLNKGRDEKELRHNIITGTLKKTTSSLLIRKKVLDKIGWYDTKMLYNEDHLLLYKVLKHGHSILFVNKPLWYNDNSSTTMNKTGWKIIVYNMRLLYKARPANIKTIIELMLRTFPYAIYTDIKRIF